MPSGRSQVVFPFDLFADPGHKKIDDQDDDGNPDGKVILSQGHGDADAGRKEYGGGCGQKLDPVFLLDLQDRAGADEADTHDDRLDDPGGIRSDIAGQAEGLEMHHDHFAQRNHEGNGAADNHVGAYTRRLIEHFPLITDDPREDHGDHHMQ